LEAQNLISTGDISGVSANTKLPISILQQRNKTKKIATINETNYDFKKKLFLKFLLFLLDYLKSFILSNAMLGDAQS